MKWPDQLLSSIALGLGFSLLSAQDPFVFDSSLSSTLPNYISNSIQVGDLDSDGINDIIFSGYTIPDSLLFYSLVYGKQNGTLTNHSTFYDSTAITDHISYYGGIGGIDLIDFNRDGSLDFHFNGSGSSKLYKNNNGTFTSEGEYPTDQSPYIGNSSWGDVNMDGAPDLFMMYLSISQQIYNQIFINNDNELAQDPTAIFPDIFNGTSAWGDYDNDGDSDLIVCGQNADESASVTRFFKNEPTGRLIEDTNQDLIGLKAGAFRFADLDADGDKDLIMSGWNKIEDRVITRIYKNEPLGTYTLAPVQIDDFGVAYGNIDAVDFDRDGLKDICISGGNIVSSYANDIYNLKGKVYKNNGDFTFSEVKEISGARMMRFADVNNDSVPDLIASGRLNYPDSTSFCHIYINDNEPNLPPSAPSSLSAFAVSTRAIFSWDYATDDIDEKVSLSYNMRIGIDSDRDSLLSSAIPIYNENIGPLLIREFNEIPHGKYYWSVQAVDASGNRSEWSEEDTLFIPRLVTSIQSLPGVYFSMANWADFNEDGFPDITISGKTFTESPITKLFLNEGGLLTQDIGQNLFGVFGGHLTFVDFTNDGHLDICLTGFLGSLAATLFYEWNEGIYTCINCSSTDPFNDVFSSLYNDNDQQRWPFYWITGGSNSHDWGDYDNDGDLDLAIAGWDTRWFNEFNGYPFSFSEPPKNTRHLHVFKNNGGSFVLDSSQTNLIGIGPGMVHWSDVNLDGYLDLVTVGTGWEAEIGSPSDTIETTQLRVYFNNHTHILSDHYNVWASEEVGLIAGSMAFGDYDSDGDDDFVITGLRPPDEENPDGTIKTFIMTNELNLFVPELLPILNEEGSPTGVYYGTPAWGDYDNDGDLDLILTGQRNTFSIDWSLGSEPVTIIYKQDNGAWIPDVTISIDSVGVSTLSWADYDLDGDIDLFLAGFKKNQDVVAKIYDNLEGIKNRNEPPSSPVLFTIEPNKDDLFLEWHPSTDDNTNTSAIRYQIQVGSDDDIYKEHMISTGNYSIGDIGSTNRNQKTINNVPEGNYFWRVRAIDQSYAISEWSSESYFYVDVTPPSIDTIRVNYVTNEQIVMVVKFADEHLNINVDPIVLITHPNDLDLDNNGINDLQDQLIVVNKQSFNGDEWTGIATLPEYYGGKAIQIYISEVEDDRGNIMPQTSVYKTPESVISKYGGTAISEDGSVIVLLPQNAVDNDISIAIRGQNVPRDSTRYPMPGGITFLITDLYEIRNIEIDNPFAQSLNKPGILRIGFPDSTCFVSDTIVEVSNGISELTVNEYYNTDCKRRSNCDSLKGDWIAVSDTGLTPFIGFFDPNDKTISDKLANGEAILPIVKLGGSEISINGDPYMQVQIDTFGVYGAFISLDSTLVSDSLDIKKLVCQPRIFSPGGTGSIFEFTETNIIYSIDKAEDVTARIFNLSGRLKRTIKPQTPDQKGHHIMNWDGKDSKGNVVPSGLYIVTLEKSDTILRTTVGVLNR